MWKITRVRFTNAGDIVAKYLRARRYDSKDGAKTHELPVINNSIESRRLLFVFTVSFPSHFARLRFRCLDFFLLWRNR